MILVLVCAALSSQYMKTTESVGLTKGMHLTEVNLRPRPCWKPSKTHKSSHSLAKVLKKTNGLNVYVGE